MPSDGEGSGNFIPQGGDGFLNYEVDSWFKEEDQIYGIDTNDLVEADKVIFKVWGDNPEEVEYSTIRGPIDSWEEIETTLGYDFGEDGSKSGAFT